MVSKEISFTLDGALAARSVIEDCYGQSVNGFLQSMEKRNIERMRYWDERIKITIDEMIWIDRVIEEQEAAAS